jgi:uncharacterized protein (TIGR03437 family)
MGLVAVSVAFFRSQAQTAQLNTVAVVSAATFEESPIAPESIAAIFGQNMAFSAASATSTPLPLTLAGTSVRIIDSAGVTHNAPLFFVSPQQVNFLIPAKVAPGTARVLVFRVTEEAGIGTIQIAPVAPGFFSANATGQGAALGYLLSVPEMGQSSAEPLAEFDSAQNRFVTRRLELNRLTFQASKLFFVLFATGVRGRESLSAVKAHVGGIEAPVLYAGAQGSFVGLDQINIPIDAEMVRKLTGRGRLNIVLSVDGYGTSNAVEIEVGGAGSPLGPKIDSFAPARALAGDTVTIKGSDLLLGGVRPLARVGGVEAAVIEAADAQIKIKVPFGAETGKLSVRNLQGETLSDATLSIRPSISGIVEDTRRRPIPNVAVRLRASVIGAALIQARTNYEGVFILADVPADQQTYIVEVDGTTTGATPHFPRVSLLATAQKGRDNPIAKPVSLQLATGTPIKVNNQASPNGIQASVPASVASLDGDWAQRLEPTALVPANEPGAQAQSCLSDPGDITLELPRDAQVSIPCASPMECANASLYVTQVENSRAPAPLPVGQFGSIMTQISPLETYFFTPGALTIPNTDCLPAGTRAKLFVFGQFGSLGLPSALGLSGRFAELGTATVSPDGQRITVDNSAIISGGIYFISVDRPTASIFGRVIEPNDDPREPLRPVRRAVITARGQVAVTDGAGSFALRGVPVLNSSDRVAIEITYLRPEGRVERAALAGVSIGAGRATTVGDLILSASNSNRPPVIIAAPTFTAEEGKSAELNFVATDPDAGAGQVLQVSVSGPPFATIVNRGNGGYTLRVAPGLEDAGNYTLTITATDNLNASSTQNIALTVFNTNQPPVAISKSVATDEDTPLKITLTASDPDRNALSYILVDRPAHGQLTGTGPDLTYLPAKNFFGGDAFTFKVNDGAADSAVATITITVNPINDAPVISVPPEQKIAAGAALKFVVSATEFDPDDLMTFTAQDLPQGAAFDQTNASSAQFSWTPTAQQTGIHVVTFKVTDNGSPTMSATQTVAISVIAANAGPRVGMWDSTGGPIGGGAVALLAKGSTVLAGTALNGVFRSTDNGDAWKRVTRGIPNSAGINAMAQVGDTIIASARFSVFRSTDNGETWTPSNDGLNDQPFLALSLAVKDDLVFAGTFNGVYVSADHGKTWKAANKGLPTLAPVSAFAVSNSTLLIAVDGTNLYRSTDDGQNWSRVPNDLPQFSQIAAFAIGSAAGGAPLFASVYGNGVYRSTDGGQHWTLMSTSQETLFVSSLLVVGDELLAGSESSLIVLPLGGQIGDPPVTVLNSGVRALATNGAAVYAGSPRDGVFRSTDGGKKWTLANKGYTNLSVSAFASTSNETFVATEVGVFVASNQALQSQQPNPWQPLNNGLYEFDSVQTLAVIGTELFAGTLTGLYRLDLLASGQNRIWQSANANLPGASAIQSIAAVDGTIFVSLSETAAPSPAAPAVFRSTDQGKSWTPAAGGLPSGAVVAFATMIGKIFAATYDGVYVSSDSGDNWTPANNGLPAQTSALSFAVSGANLFVGTAGRGVFVSSNHGQGQGPIWTPAALNLPANATVSSLLANGSKLFALVVAADPTTQCPNGGVFIDGRCWGGIIRGSVKRPAISTAPDQFVGVLGLIPGDLFISTNGGRNWAPIMSGLSRDSVTAIGANGADVFAGTLGQGVFARRF